MPINTRLRLNSVADIKNYLTQQVERYSAAELDRLDKADEAREAGQFVDSAALLAVAAKKKIVRQKFQKLLRAIA